MFMRRTILPEYRCISFALYELPEDQQQELQEDDLVIGENV